GGRVDVGGGWDRGAWEVVRRGGGGGGARSDDVEGQSLRGSNHKGCDVGETEVKVACLDTRYNGGATLGFLQIDFEAMFFEHAFFNTQVQWCYIHYRYNADVYFSQFAGFCSLVGIVVRAAAGAQHY